MVHEGVCGAVRYRTMNRRRRLLACFLLAQHAGATNKKAVADARLYGGITLRRSLRRSAWPFVKARRRRGKARAQAPHQGRTPRQARRPAKFAARAISNRRANLQAPTRAGAEDKNELDSSSCRFSCFSHIRRQLFLASSVRFSSRASFRHLARFQRRWHLRRPHHRTV